MANILIVGAGIAGLAMARRLTDFDIPFRIIERSPTLSIAGCGIALPYNAVASMEKLGLGKTLMESAHVVKNVTFAKSNGTVLAQESLSTAPFESATFVALHREKLLQVLAEGISETVEWGTSLEGLKQDEQVIEVATNNWAERFDLVIAADGIHSKVRQVAVGDEAEDYGFRTWRFTSNQPNHNIQPSYYYGGSDMFMAYPISKDQIYCYGHVSDDRTNKPETGSDETDILKLFGKYRADVPSLLKNMDADSIIRGRVLALDQASFAVGRIAFIGDAGNGCTPSLQQGAACALEDVLCLANQLHGNEIDQALKRYTELRRARVEWILEQSNTPYKLIRRTDNIFFQVLRNWYIKKNGPGNINGWRELASNEALAFSE